MGARVPIICFDDACETVKLLFLLILRVETVRWMILLLMVTIRMNVDDFNEARTMLESRGFTAPGEVVTDASSKSIGMISPSGFMISLVEHIKK